MLILHNKYQESLAMHLWSVGYVWVDILQQVGDVCWFSLGLIFESLHLWNSVMSSG